MCVGIEVEGNAAKLKPSYLVVIYVVSDRWIFSPLDILASKYSPFRVEVHKTGLSE